MDLPWYWTMYCYWTWLVIQTGQSNLMDWNERNFPFFLDNQQWKVFPVIKLRRMTFQSIIFSNLRLSLSYRKYQAELWLPENSLSASLLLPKCSKMANSSIDHWNACSVNCLLYWSKSFKRCLHSSRFFSMPSRNSGLILAFPYIQFFFIKTNRKWPYGWSDIGVVHVCIDEALGGTVSHQWTR